MSGDVHLERQVAAKNVEKTSPGASERPPGRAKSRPGGPGRAKKRAKTERKCERVALRIIFCQCERSRSAGQGETQPSEERRRVGHPSPSMRICEWTRCTYLGAARGALVCVLRRVVGSLSSGAVQRVNKNENGPENQRKIIPKSTKNRPQIDDKSAQKQANIEEKIDKKSVLGG